MKRRLMDYLRCPRCGSADLQLDVEKETPDGQIEEGAIVCRAKGESYPIVGGIPRMLVMQGSLDDTRHKFEHQWRTWGQEDVIFGRTKDESRQYLLQTAGFGLQAGYFKGKRTLDAGCGHGRFVEVLSEMDAELSVGIDLGSGIQAAAYRNAARPNVELVQGNLLEIPFRDSVFDYVWCNGVIHHTPNPKGAAKNLCAVARPDGYVNLWLYPKGSAAWEISQALIRAVTTRLPAPLLSALCYLPVPLLYLVPTYSGTNPRKNTWKHCAQVIYDWYSPRYQSHHTNEEVVGWMREFGMRATDLAEPAVTVIAQK